jgi:hypothetical protein
MVGNAPMAVAALLATRCSLAYSHKEVWAGQIISEGSRSHPGQVGWEEQRLLVTAPVRRQPRSSHEVLLGCVRT